MGKKYIVKLDDNKLAYTAIIIDGVPYIKPLQLLPYTEPDMEKIRKRGYDKGLDDIGNALRLLLFQYSNYTLQEIFGYDTARAVVEHFEGSEIVARIRCYEGGVKQDVETIRKEAYQKGYEDATVKISSDEQAIAEKAYQSGLSDAWEAARKISMAEINGRCSWKSMKNIFGIDIPSKIFKNFTASESIEKLKAYEQEQGTEIKVGNEVKAFEKKPFIVTGIGYGYDEKDVYYHGFVTENGISTSAKKDECVKTGRYFPEIAEVMRKMKEG